jgi:hypothetical protein
MSTPCLRLRRLAVPLAGILGLAIAAPAFAQERERNPYYLGASQTFSHDDNVFRSATNPVSETISSTGVLAGFDQPIGRQRFYGDASAQYNKYRNLDGLDNKSYALTAGVDWETIEFLSGQLRYSTRNSLADFGTLGGSGSASDQTTQQMLATARYGITSKLLLDAGYEHRRLDYSSDVFLAREYSQNAVNAGLRWGTTGLLTVGLAYRLTNGSTPYFQATAPFEDELKRRDIDLSVVWTPSGFSTLNARLSSTKETHSLSSNAELSAVTGSLSWNYRPTAKLSFTSSVIRDTGRETTFLANPDSETSSLPVDSNRLSTLGQLEVAYAVTSKVSFNADVRHRKGTLANNAGSDKVTGYGAGLSYAPTRNTSLNCNVMRESRDVQGTSAYSATTSSCSAQITLR